MKIRILISIGTRPEALKLLLLAKELTKNPKFEVLTCLTGQHADLVDSIVKEEDFGGRKVNLKLLREGQSTSEFFSKLTIRFQEVLDEFKPDLVIVQGDTSSAMLCSYLAFVSGIDLIHIEAGLRTHDVYSPFPEEANRKMIGCIATLHFSPTELSRQNLIKEGVNPSNIYVTGNTIIDLLKVRFEESSLQLSIPKQIMECHRNGKHVILVTVHRNENIGTGLREVSNAVNEIASMRPDVVFFVPVHPNPKVKSDLQSGLQIRPNIVLISPLGHLETLSTFSIASLVMTDSGGIQEEAPSFSCPLLILREKTERMEGILVGAAKLVGLNSADIMRAFNLALPYPSEKRKACTELVESPYGDGRAVQKIVDVLNERY